MNKMDKILLSLLGVISALVVLIGGLVGSYVSAPPADVSLGALASNVVLNEEFVVGNVSRFHYERDMVATSTNVCSILTPNASTTLEAASAILRVGQTGIGQLYIARAANNWASTTLLAGESITAGEKGSIVATSSWEMTVGTALTDNVIPPNSYINFQKFGNTGTGARGICRLVLQEASELGQ